MGRKLITEEMFADILVEEKGQDLYIYGVFSSAELKNGNGRVYGRNLLEREIKKINEKIDRSLWGELGHPPCIFGDNEILTKDGWKEIQNIANDEVVATLNPDSREIEYHQIDERIEAPFVGDMFRYKNRQVDMSFTPTHRHFLIDRYNKHLFATSEEVDQSTTRRFKKCYIPKTGTWIGNDIDVFTLKGFSVDECKNRKFKKDYTENVEIDMNVFISFLGIYLAKGNLSKGGDGTYTCVHISHIKEESSLMIEKLLDMFPEGMKWGRKDREFILTDRRLSKFLEGLGNCYSKYIPDEFKQLSPQYLEQLLYWFGVGDDRHSVDDNGYERRGIFSTSKRMIDDFHEIALKCDISAMKTVEICDTDYVFGGRVIKACNKQPLYFLKLYTSKGIWMFDDHTNVSKESYNGNVYCVRVKNQNFYVRNKDSVSFWTGNCPEINPDKIAIRVESLDWKGNDIIGKAKVLDTPMGNIAKTLVKEGGIGISSRGLGTVGSDGRVNDDFNLLTWDLVTEPSNSPSWVRGIYEGKEWDSIVAQPELSVEEAQEIFAKHQMELIKKLLKNI
jgi:hypothetical protein